MHQSAQFASPKATPKIPKNPRRSSRTKQRRNSHGFNFQSRRISNQKWPLLCCKTATLYASSTILLLSSFSSSSSSLPLLFSSLPLLLYCVNHTWMNDYDISFGQKKSCTVLKDFPPHLAVELQKTNRSNTKNDNRTNNKRKKVENENKSRILGRIKEEILHRYVCVCVCRGR